MDYTKDMELACELLHEQLGDLVRKIKNNGMSTGDLEKLDKLTHSLKSVKGTMQMEQADEEGYSGYYPYMGGYGRGSYDNGGSYARKRDSMGRYSRERGYSRNDLADKMRELMADAPDDRTRQEIQRMVEKLENA
jgi:hypothetical protein